MTSGVLPQCSVFRLTRVGLHELTCAGYSPVDVGNRVRYSSILPHSFHVVICGAHTSYLDGLLRQALFEEESERSEDDKNGNGWDWQTLKELKYHKSGLNYLNGGGYEVDGDT